MANQTQVINANNLQLYVGFDATRATTTTGAGGERLPIANASSADYTVSVDMIDVTSKASNRNRELIPGQISRTISTSALLDNLVEADTTSRTAAILQQYADTGGIIYFEFGIGDARFVGQGYIASFGLSGGTNDAPTYDITIEVNGAPTYDSDVTQ